MVFHSSIAHIRDPLLRKGSRFTLAGTLIGVPAGVPNRIGGTGYEKTPSAWTTSRSPSPLPVCSSGQPRWVGR